MRRDCAPFIALKDFQQNFVEVVSEEMTQELAKSKLLRKELHLVSPTGSGKTFMMRETLKLFLNANSVQDTVFLWISTSTGGLLNQSYQTFKETFEGSQLPVVKLEDLLKKTDHENTIVFTAWEAINSKEKNKIYQASEQQGEGLETFLLKNSHLRFIGIIDESHRNIGDKESKSSIAYELFNYELTICLTATPIVPEVDIFKQKVNSGESGVNVKTDLTDKWIYVVSEREVVKSQLITEETHYNLRPNGESYFEPTTEFESVELGLERLRQLQQVSHRYNPLMLIQLQNEGAENKQIKSEKLPKIEALLQREGVNYRIWLNKDDDTKNAKYKLTEDEKGEIKKNDSEIEVLIFKQAVAIGWDCPRAKILVKERDTKSKTFDEQVLGRIRRIPGGNYELDHATLKNAYVYSHHIQNTAEHQVSAKLGEFEKILLLDEIQALESKPFSIPIFSQQVVAELYYDRMLKELKDYDFKGFKLNKATYFSKTTAGRERTYSGEINESDSLSINRSILAIKTKVFYNLLRIKHHFNGGISPLLIIQLLHDCFSMRYESQSYEETYVLIANNQALIEKCLTELFEKLIRDIYRPRITSDICYQPYSIPQAISYNTEANNNELSVILTSKDGFLISRYLYQQPFLSDSLQSTEQVFLRALNRKVEHLGVKYWVKNSTKSDSFFMMRSDGQRFFPDFLIQLEDDSIWIYEVKGYGEANIENDTEMKKKKEALDLYLEFAKSNEFEIYGEIVAFDHEERCHRWNENGYWEVYELFSKPRQI